MFVNIIYKRTEYAKTPMEIFMNKSRRFRFGICQNILNRLRYFIADPVNLSFKYKILSAIACFASIFFITLVTRIFFPEPHYPMLVASMGASAIILFFIPGSPLAQPWPIVGGQICSAWVGISCSLHIEETASAAAAAVGGAVLVMLALRCLHPPAAATALTPVLSTNTLTPPNYTFVWVPVGINILCLLILAIIINRWVMKRDYPSALTNGNPENSVTPEASAYKIGISRQDMERALQNMDVFVDMSQTDLKKLLTLAEMNTFERIRGRICCADIMEKDIPTVEFATEVEEAWKLMQRQRLKALPVVDNSHRIIGIVTQHDFFKFIDLSSYETLQQKFLDFIRRTAKLTASKPEFIGLIMASPVIVLPGNAHIVELIPLMSMQGHRQIPIIDTEHHLIGMVYQSDLIASLYNETLSASNPRKKANPG